MAGEIRRRIDPAGIPQAAAQIFLHELSTESPLDAVEAQEIFRSAVRGILVSQYILHEIKFELITASLLAPEVTKITSGASFTSSAA
jgi:hypothetical protein